MVRGITNINTTRVCNFINNKRNAKSMELPAKVALGAIASMGVSNKIGDLNPTDSFVLKCSDYDRSSDDSCNSDYWCGLAFP